MSDSKNYKNKYLKYKQKYINLKNKQKGGNLYNYFMSFFSSNKNKITDDMVKGDNVKEIINNYVFKKKDLCCYDNPHRQKLIQILYNLYKINETYKDEYLDQIHNDIGILFPTRTLEYSKQEEDVEGKKILEYLYSLMIKDKKVSKEKMDKFLNEIPVYYILSLIGYHISVIYQHRILKDKIIFERPF
tara:strand:- start:100 stop:663 length:564 start_codon:yes stop_codon:yes gene_type:complete